MGCAKMGCAKLGCAKLGCAKMGCAKLGCAKMGCANGKTLRGRLCAGVGHLVARRHIGTMATPHHPDVSLRDLVHGPEQRGHRDEE